MSASQRVRRFRNPSNGYEEKVGEAWLWCLLLGPVYFAAKGIWFHAATSLLLAIATGGISWFIYPFFANWSVRKHYLRSGWVPEEDKPKVTDAAPNRRLSWWGRRRYRRDLLDSLQAVMMTEPRNLPAIDEVLDHAQNKQWEIEETAVLYAGKHLAKRIAAIPDAERRQRIGEPSLRLCGLRPFGLEW